METLLHLVAYTMTAKLMFILYYQVLHKHILSIKPYSQVESN